MPEGPARESGSGDEPFDFSSRDEGATNIQGIDVPTRDGIDAVPPRCSHVKPSP